KPAPLVPATRQVLATAPDSATSLSPDGRFLGFVDRQTGNLALRDLVSSEIRKLAEGSLSGAGEYAMGHVFSPDGKSVAYGWVNKDQKIDLRVIGVEGGNPRVVYVPQQQGIFPKPI